MDTAEVESAAQPSSRPRSFDPRSLVRPAVIALLLLLVLLALP
jgi:hypothetical protein